MSTMLTPDTPVADPTVITMGGAYWTSVSHYPDKLAGILTYRDLHLPVCGVYPQYSLIAKRLRGRFMNYPSKSERGYH